MTETAKMRPEPIKVETLRHRRSAGRDKLKKIMKLNENWAGREAETTVRGAETQYKVQINISLPRGAATEKRQRRGTKPKAPPWVLSDISLSFS